MISFYINILQQFEYTAINDTEKLLNKNNIEYTRTQSLLISLINIDSLFISYKEELFLDITKNNVKFPLTNEGLRKSLLEMVPHLTVPTRSRLVDREKCAEKSRCKNM